MDNRILLEDIKRMHKLIGITPNILIESVIAEGIVDKEAVAVFKSIFGNIERAVVAGGKSYTKNQVKQVIGKIGLMELSNEEKILVQTLTREAIALDKQLMKRLSNEVYGEMQKLPNRRLRTAHYGRVKRGLKEVLPKEEFNILISDVNAKLNIKPKPSTPPTPKPPKTPNTGEGGSSVFIDTTDEELMQIIRSEFTDLNINLKVTAKQEKYFLSQVKPEIHRLYSEVEPRLYVKYKDLHGRYNQVPSDKRKEVIKNAIVTLKKEGIGLNIPERLQHNFFKYLEESLQENFTNGYKKFKRTALLTAMGMGINYLASEITKGKAEMSFIFGFSFKQNILFKTLLGILGIFTKGLPSLIVAMSSLIIAAGESVMALVPGKDMSELLGMSPLSIEEAKSYVENNKNPLQIKYDMGEDVTKYEPLDKNMKVMDGNLGAFVRVYVNNNVYSTLKKELATGKIKEID